MDWAGQTANLTDPDTGDLVKAYISVGLLSYSQCVYVEAFVTQDLESWITAPVHMFQYFGGVSQVLLPDSLKTSITKPDWYSPEIQRNYQEMAEHYDTVIVPARINKPRHKANVESSVGKISTWILAPIRHMRFFSIAELNDAIKEKLESYNHRPFQEKRSLLDKHGLCSYPRLHGRKGNTARFKSICLQTIRNMLNGTSIVSSIGHLK